MTNRRVLGSLLGAAFLFSFTAVEVRAQEPCVPHDDASQFICRYGKPDVDDSAEHDNPRPPFVFRALTYKKERVLALYGPDVRESYKKWNFIQFKDPETDAILSAEEVTKRMKARDTKK